VGAGWIERKMRQRDDEEEPGPPEEVPGRILG